MKKVFFALMLLGFSTLSITTVAQDDVEKPKEKSKKESQEIIIRKKGDKDIKITVDINGDKVTINGKPLSEFKDDNITINRRNITVWDKNGNKGFEFAPGEFMDGFSWSSGGESRGFLGVTTDESEDGAKIVEITKESAAEKAGLKKGDVITKVGDEKIEGPDDLTDVISDMKPKADAKIYYKRDGKENSVTATLGERKESMSYSYSGPSKGFNYSVPRVPRTLAIPRVESWGEGNSFHTPNFDFNDQFKDFHFDINGRSRAKLGIKIQDTEDESGVKTLDVDKDSPAEKAGLKKDDIITEIGGEKVTNTDEAREQLHNNAEKAAYSIKAKRNGTTLNFDIKTPKKLKTTNL